MEMMAVNENSLGVQCVLQHRKKNRTNYLVLERYGHCLSITLWNRIFGVG
jgi:hypothetical protein